MVKKKILLITNDNKLKDSYKKRLSTKYKITPSNYFKNFEANYHDLILIDCRRNYITMGIETIKRVGRVKVKTNIIAIVDNIIPFKLEEFFDVSNVVDFIDNFYDFKLIRKVLAYYIR